jgi:lysophospholipase L1-like esterase
MVHASTTALFTGDSITDAGRLSDPRGQLGDGYVRRVAELAAVDAPRLSVINTGVSGDRTTDLLGRWTEDVIQHQPDILTILIGINDVWRRYDSGMPMAGAEYAANYAALLDRVRAELRLRQLVIMEPFLVPVSEDQSRWPDEDLDEKRAIARDLAGRYDATFIPLHELFAARAAVAGADSVVDDGVHPSAGGHELIARAWWSAVEV